MLIDKPDNHFVIQLERFGRSPVARLTGLVRSFRDLDKQNQETKTALPITTDSVESLKTMIYQEVLRSKVKHPNVVTDQILFLLIGAIQLSHKQDSEKAWDIVSDSIHEFLTPTTDYKVLFSFSSVISVLLIACVFFIYTSTTNQHSQYVSPEFGESGSASTLNMAPATIVALQDVYKQMKKGICQLPQAGMLAEDQRSAYLSFINDGVVDVNTADSLEKALRHVSCAYPQQLMMTPR